jgi:hypothetical protein
MDTGADGHYIGKRDMSHLDNLRLNQTTGYSVIAANNSRMTSTHTGELALGSLGFPAEALTAHAFADDDMERSLVSMSKLADSGFTSIFTRTDAMVVNDKDPAVDRLIKDLRAVSIIQAPRDSQGLWTMPLTTQSPTGTQPMAPAAGTALALIRHENNAEKVRFFSRTFGSLPSSVLIKAVDRGLFTFHGVTAAMIRNNRPNDIETAMGHMRLINQHLRSTKQAPTVASSPPRTSSEVDIDDFYPTAEQPRREIFTRVVEVTAKQYMDATGAFPVRAHDGALYILCVYDYDGNYVRAEPLKSNSAIDVRNAYSRALEFFRQSGYTPALLVLDIATSGLLEAFLKKENIKFQFVTPSNHRANIAERAIQTFKNHFVSTLVGTDPAFPLIFWSYMIPQAEITLNLVRTSRVTPNQSAWQHITGRPYDFNACPMAPPGTKVLVFDSPEARRSWDPHGKVGFYVGPAQDHYRNYTVRMLATGAERHADTVSWHPVNYKMPFSDPMEATELAVRDLTSALRVLATAPPYLISGPQPHEALKPSMHALAQSINIIFGAPDAIAATPTTPTVASEGGVARDDTAVTQQMAETTPDDLHDAYRPDDALAPPQDVPPTLSPALATPPDTGGPQRVPTAQKPDGEKSDQPTTAPTLTPTPRSAQRVVETTTSEPTKQRKTQRVRKTTEQKPPGTPPPSHITPRAAPPILDPRRASLSLLVKSGGRQPRRATPPEETYRVVTTPEHLSDLSARNLKDLLCNHDKNHHLRGCTNRDDLVAAVIAAKIDIPVGRAQRTRAQVKTTLHNTIAQKHKQRVEPPPRRQRHRLTPHERYRTATKYGVANVASAVGGRQDRTHTRGSARVVTADPLTGRPLRWNTLQHEPGPQAALLTEEIRLWEKYAALEMCHPAEKPPDYKPTYFNPALSWKRGDYRVRGTAGGDRMDFTGPTTAQTASIQTVKCLLNAVVSEPDAIFTTADISDYFLGTPLDSPEYMWVRRDQMTETSRTKYRFEDFAVGNRVLVRILKAIYGLPQAALLAQLQLTAHLATHGYRPDKTVACLYHHDTRDIKFTLVVDDFGIKSKQHKAEDLEHLLQCLRLKYRITVDDTGTSYLGFTLKWDYAPTAPARRSVELSMPAYVKKALLRFNVTAATRKTVSPGGWQQPQYGAKTQLSPAIDTSPPLPPAEVTRIQQIVGVFLYYARVLDLTMLCRVTQLASMQAQATEAVRDEVDEFLKYCATYPSVSIKYFASDMRLYWISDAAYLSERRAGSRFGGIGYCGDNPSPHITAGGPHAPSFVNGVLHAVSVRSDVQVASAAEAEFGALFVNGKQATEIRHILAALGYPQPATWMETDNTTACKLANGTTKHRTSKAIDMRFFWIEDRVQQGHFLVYWGQGSSNIADFVTKNHPPKYHRENRTRYVQDVPAAP